MTVVPKSLAVDAKMVVWCSLCRSMRKMRVKTYGAEVWTGVATGSDGEDTWVVVLEDAEDVGEIVIKIFFVLDGGKGCELRAASTPRSWKPQEHLVDGLDLGHVVVPLRNSGTFNSVFCAKSVFPVASDGGICGCRAGHNT